MKVRQSTTIRDLAKRSGYSPETVRRRIRAIEEREGVVILRVKPGLDRWLEVDMPALERFW